MSKSEVKYFKIIVWTYKHLTNGSIWTTKIVP